MKPRFLCWLLALLPLFGLAAPILDTTPAARTWLQRPWEIRYVLFVEPARRMQSEIMVARQMNLERGASGSASVYLSAAALFEPTATLPDAGTEAVAVLALAFDPDGRIINQKGVLKTMSARRNLLDTLVLIDENAPDARPYDLADWAQGIPGDVTFSPAVCGADDTRRYTAVWDLNSPAGSFGCREWTAQLYNRKQPYIDVTSYASHRSFIGEVLGWSRFEDPPTPVIGKHGKVWLCLHECPRGEKPGMIPDIRAWTTRHGYPMPVRPSKQPLYPNADYMDDLNEFAE